MADKGDRRKKYEISQRVKRTGGTSRVVGTRDAPKEIQSVSFDIFFHY